MNKERDSEKREGRVLALLEQGAGPTPLNLLLATEGRSDALQVSSAAFSVHSSALLQEAAQPGLPMVMLF